VPITAPEVWKLCEAANQDRNGKACIDIARKVMELLDEEPGAVDASNLIARAQAACEATNNISGFMAGCIAQIVITCHSRGEEFRKSWNTCWDAEEDDQEP
jgi:hypothetical protein